MSRPLTAAGAAWAVAILAAVAGVELPSAQERVSLGLFAFAVAMGLMVAVGLIAGGIRQRRVRQRRDAAATQSPLVRLEYLPPVTTRTRRIHWRGGRYRVTRARPRPQPSPALTEELTGSAHPPPALPTAPLVERARRPAVR